jgi:hypothetical protein
MAQNYCCYVAHPSKDVQSLSFFCYWPGPSSSRLTKNARKLGHKGGRRSELARSTRSSWLLRAEHQSALFWRFSKFKRRRHCITGVEKSIENVKILQKG